MPAPHHVGCCAQIAEPERDQSSTGAFKTARPDNAKCYARATNTMWQGEMEQQTSTEAEAKTAGEAMSPGMLFALVNQQRELLAEVDRLQARRTEVLSAQGSSAAQKQSAAREVDEINTQIARVEASLRGIDAALATSGSSQSVTSTGTTVPPAQGVSLNQRPTDGELLLVGAMLICVAIPTLFLVIGARRLRREVRDLRAQVGESLGRVTLGVETMAIEIERVGEAQRFLIKSAGDKGDSERA